MFRYLTITGVSQIHAYTLLSMFRVLDVLLITPVDPSEISDCMIPDCIETASASPTSISSLLLGPPFVRY